MGIVGPRGACLIILALAQQPARVADAQDRPTPSKPPKTSSPDAGKPAPRQAHTASTPDAGKTAPSPPAPPPKPSAQPEAVPAPAPGTPPPKPQQAPPARAGAALTPAPGQQQEDEAIMRELELWMLMEMMKDYEMFHDTPAPKSKSPEAHPAH